MHELKTTIYSQQLKTKKMKITTTKQELKRGLAITGDIAKPGTLPILSHILMSNKDKAMTFTASDIGMQVSTKSASDNDEDFAITIPAAKFVKIISSLPDDAKITLDINDEKLTVKSGRSKFALQTLSAVDFPLMALDAVQSSIDITQESFKSTLQNVMHAMAVTDVRHYLNGVLFEVKDGILTLVGTDGNRMAVDSMATDAEDMSKILTRQSVLKIVKLLSDGEMTINFYEGKVKFIIGETEFTSQLIEGKFPDWRRVMPKNQPNKIEVTRSQMIESINRASVVLEKLRAMKITIGKELNMSCQLAGEVSSDEFPIEFECGQFELGVNPDFLKDAISAFNNESITFSLFDKGNGAMLIEDGTSLKCVVMPTRI